MSGFLATINPARKRKPGGEIMTMAGDEPGTRTTRAMMQGTHDGPLQRGRSHQLWSRGQSGADRSPGYII